MRHDRLDGLGCAGVVIFGFLWVVGVLLTLAFWAAVFAILGDIFNFWNVVDFV